MTIKTLIPTDQRVNIHANATGTHDHEKGPAQPRTLLRSLKPRQVVRVIFITPDQAKQLPTLPADALQIAVAPAGGL